MFNHEEVQKLFWAGFMWGLEVGRKNSVQVLPELFGKLGGRGVWEGAVSNLILVEGVPIGDVKGCG